tara:strand:+ start:8841 stop:10145 length:1305 start_codon:yes stop_codon:yes gene_type:complete
MINIKLNFFSKKKILIYGLGKSGLSAFEFLRKKSEVSLFDDFKLGIKNLNIKKKIIDYKELLNSHFDFIILSPGIDIKKCKLSKFLKRNYKKVYSDLDVFYAYFRNDCITITGTNGKSTTCQLLYEIMRDQNLDVRLVGNIGNPILSSRNIKKKTILIVEASSYQLEYSKIFRSKYAAILNLSPDHIERHGTLNNYVKSKFKLLKNQTNRSLAFLKKDDLLISKELLRNKFFSKIIRVDTKKNNILLNTINNKYFLSETNRENLFFVLEILKKFKIKRNLLLKSIQKFEGLKFRQQIIFKKENLKIINDSKSTSFSSSLGLLKQYQNIHWILGGIPKKGDKLILSKKYFNNISAYIYGNNKNFFIKKLKGKIKYEIFKNLKHTVNEVIKIAKKNQSIHQTILFSPCAASFDTFKNFEERGHYFNKLIRKHLYGK